MADLGSRPILPQGSRTYAFANQTEPSREKQKNYVFVDEHNRHRRLKVMRACGACRRRKIKCDAATTNTWPCAACLKQNLECVPPSSETDGQDDADGFDVKQGDFHSFQPHNYSGGPAFSVAHYGEAAPTSASYDYPLSMPAAESVVQQPTSNGWQMQMPTSGVYAQGGVPEGFGTDPPLSTSTTATFPNGIQDIPRSASTKSETPDSELADALQDLRIDQAGVAPYIANQRTLAEGPAVEEAEVVLPPSVTNNSTVSIPPEMMPPDHQATQYIEYFFANTHPYVPVLNRSYFYQQWNHNKFSISPLILEAIFACSAHNLQQYEDRNRWLALASRHEESFKDVPRLSTIQGLTLLLKAREAVPKRGYYYRSWMAIQYLIAMAKDLEIDQHNWAHVRGQPCGCEDYDCAVKTRLWHALFQNEMMIGGPQGRYEFSVDIDSVITNASQPFPGVDESERKISQDQIQMVRIVKNIRQTSGIYARLRRKVSNFAEDPDFVRHNIDYYNWTEGLPRHLQITYDPDGSAPWIPFHFAANLHAYHLLGVILHHRPQLNTSSGSYDHSWKQIMVTCYSAATRICRLHEAVIKRYGLNGLSCMSRGVNTAIYTILSCTMLHLVAITSPDQELNANAKDYFTRHMRMLEQCSTMWPMQSMQIQINSLREAFSADLNKPFELKPSFPFGSPPPSDTSSPPSSHNVGSHQPDGSQWGAYEGGPLTPPGTSSTGSMPHEFSGGQAYSDPSQTYAAGSPASHGGQGLDPAAQWDPSGVFDRWNAAFNTAALDSPSPGLPSIQPVSGTPTQTSGAMYAGQNMAYTSYPQQPLQSPRFPTQIQQAQGNYMAQTSAATVSGGLPTAAPQPYVTPSMWQDAVAKSYGENLKRQWDDQQTSSSHKYKRVR